MEAIKCAVVGLGRIGSILEDDELREKPATHAGSVIHNPETALVAGCDINPERRKMFSKRWDIDTVYPDAAEMIEKHRPDILHISTHADSHMHYLELAVRKKIPVVICEKPVSDSLRKALRIQKMLIKPECRTRVIVNHERRYAADYLRVKEHIRNRVYGELLSIDAKVYIGRSRAVRDILMHDGTHMLDLIPFLTGGKLENIKVLKPGGLFHGQTAAHTVMINGISAGIPVFCRVGNSRDHLVFELELSFSEGMIRIGNGVYGEYSSEESPYYEGFRSLKMTENAEDRTKTNYFSGMLRDAVRLVKDPAARPVSSFDDGVESLRIIKKVQRFI